MPWRWRRQPVQVSCSPCSFLWASRSVFLRGSLPCREEDDDNGAEDEAEEDCRDRAEEEEDDDDDGCLAVEVDCLDCAKRDERAISSARALAATSCEEEGVVPDVALRRHSLQTGIAEPLENFLNYANTGRGKRALETERRTEKRATTRWAELTYAGRILQLVHIGMIPSEFCIELRLLRVCERCDEEDLEEWCVCKRSAHDEQADLRQLPQKTDAWARSQPSQRMRMVCTSGRLAV
ncbi:hypothetical protein FGB62_68g045 [Gracilaria domingensis]|nr:hypothetical protein FGB62_68g045 [Gracilaria domingensis]